MVQLIMGLKGSGKTKRLVEMVATAVREERIKNSPTIFRIRHA